jgi:formate-dependent nitrite reductase cytochrome c552 subunit
MEPAIAPGGGPARSPDDSTPSACRGRVLSLLPALTYAALGAPILKAQHPEFELWSQGIHARSGVACADCHMPYMRDGATKVSDHWVRSPLLNVSRACQVCHKFSEEEIRARVDRIQNTNHELLQSAGQAMVDLIDGIIEARKAGATEEQLAPALKFQRRAQWRLDYVAAENSMGFHAPQEAARILCEATDLARQGQVAVLRLRLGAAEKREDTNRPEGGRDTNRPEAGRTSGPRGADVLLSIGRFVAKFRSA